MLYHAEASFGYNGDFLPVSKRRLDPEAGRKQVSPKTQKMEGRAGNGEGRGEREEGGAEKFQFRKVPETLLIHVRRPPMPQSPRRARGEEEGREEERVKKRILLPEKTSVKEGKKERKRERERWMNDDTNVQRTVFFAAAQKPGEREGGWAKFAVSETNETAALSSFMM